MRRETRLERAVHRLMRAGRRALHAQERYDYWNQFGTGSSRAQSADTNRDKALAELEAAEADAEEALFQKSVGD